MRGPPRRRAAIIAPVPAPPRAPPFVPSSSREPFLASAFARPPGPRARDDMQAWAASVSVRLRGLGFDGGAETGAPIAASSTLELLASSEQWGGLSRATVALSIDEEHVEVSMVLPPAGARAVRARIVEPVRALELSTALESLPDQFAVGLAGENERSPASRASTDEIRALLERADREDRALWLGWSITRDVAVEHAALLDEQLEDAVVALGSVFTTLPAAHDGGLGAPRGPSLKYRRREGKLDTVREELEEEAEAPTRPRARSARSGSGRGGRPPSGDLSSPSARRSKTRAEARKPLEKGAHVRVLEGPFSGKVGVVQELDGKGAARVMLGLLAVRVAVTDLARCAEGRRRPILSTSHRKPMPARS